MNEFLIKHISLRPEDIKSNQGNGGPAKVFGEVTRDLREAFAGKVSDIRSRFEQRFAANPNVPSVAKVRLKQEAIAKSHRPTSLFSTSTCPIIGVGKSDELLVEVTRDGLNALSRKILSSDAKITKANISTLQDFQAYDLFDVLSNEVYKRIRELRKKYIKLRVFDFLNHNTNLDSYTALINRISNFSGEFHSKIQYAKNLDILKVSFPNLDVLEEFADFGALRSLSYFQTLSVTNVQSTQLDTASTSQMIFPVFWPDTQKEYPYVGVIDTGISQSDKLAPWVDKTEEYVIPSEKNCSHGSFVGGIIAYGDKLDGTDSPYDGVKIVDISVIPNSDPSYGDVGFLEEENLVLILQEVVPKYSDRVKVWNMSLGFKDAFCEEQSYSDLAVSFDQLQDENNVIFVVSTGNYEVLPHRNWPPNQQDVYKDRITAPADSLRAITVGSISHLDTNMTANFEPSPFTRIGFGPNYTIKPDLVDFGGTYKKHPVPRVIPVGINSFDENGILTQDVGTSFSTPKVAALLAKLFHYLDSEPSSNLAKALLIHSATDPKTGSRPEGEYRKYVGFGKPASIEKILTGSASSSTLIFEGTIYPTTHIDISDFPFPDCLIENGKCTGEITMTLVYNPRLDARYDFEYCRTNIEVSFGTEKPKGFKSEVPIEKSGILEKELVENGYKWSPIKVYSRKFSKGIDSNQWKLRLSLQSRSEEVPQPQDFALIITIRDPKGEKPVYNDISKQLTQRFIYRDITTTVRLRNEG
ncbi:S8 family peptidase [Tumebacillus sp. ITR2]|uniref:S8 family peptidase n=1 Tax=Tumebacillus amylolyticus TaxID=2801339 RepID=A0ABS1JCE7_9BACL|nr:S8 family peptidase [Tumebacillus amylolyticus]MBL0387941.1 S8 family peptidase [Tumebacillus amylolyticus]